MTQSWHAYTEREAEEGRREQRERAKERFTEHRTPDQIHEGMWQEYEEAMSQNPPDIAYADEMLDAMREAGGKS